MQRLLYLLLVCVAVVYLLGFGAEPISTIDDQAMLAGAMSLVKTGKLVLPERFAEPRSGGATFGRTAPGGEVYIKYPPGYPLMLAAFLFPAKAAGAAFGGLAADLILCLPSMLFLLGATALLWHACIRLGLPQSSAHVTAAGFALGTYVWPYAGVNFSEPLQMLCVTAAFYSLLVSVQDESRWKRHVLFGGLALGFGVLTKSSLGLLMPVMAAGAAWGWAARNRMRTGLTRAALFGLPSILAGMYLLAVNTLRFGDAGDMGYRGEAFSGSLIAGLHGLTVGWDKGVIWFAPIVVLVPVGLWKLRRRSWIGPTLAASCLAYLFLISLWYGWRGGNCWGPRLLMPVLPLALLLAAAAMDSVPWRRAGMALAAVGFAVNCLGVVVNYQAYYIAAGSSPVKPDWQDPLYSQIRGHFWLMRVQLAKSSLSDPEESVPLWSSPPWIVRSAAAKPAPYQRYEEPIAGSWPLRLALRKPWARRADLWYLRSLMEVAIMRYEERDLQGAMALVREGLRIEPSYTPLVAAQGMLYYTARDFPRALAQFDRSLGLDPEYELGWYGRGLAMQSLGNKDEAIRSYKRLLQIPRRSVSRQELEQRLAMLAK